ncbi:prepilin peptidase [Candidatus Woesearchaeota archaeon]|nr:prepilin peptidase [Candidatus Woesearchaeota archaeon]
MAVELILYALVFACLCVATYTDLKTREVPDWLSYGMVFSGVGLNLLAAIVYRDYTIIARSLLGLGAFFAFAALMFYSGQWGGGDSKVLMGMGAMLGLDWHLSEFPFMFNFFVNVLVVGALYGLAWSFVLILRSFQGFRKEFRRQWHKRAYKLVRLWIGIFGVLSLMAFLLTEGGLSRVMVALAYSGLAVSYVLWVSMKAVEKACMLRSVEPAKLTEGDWIVRDIRYRGKYICGPKDLGISKPAIRALVRLFKMGKIKKVLIKEGIPFVPSFLIAFGATLLLGNVFLLFL